MEEKKGFIKNQENRIYYKVIGDGYPLIFLHGNSEDHSIFIRQVEYFKDRYKLVLIDSRGHGQSSFNTKPIFFKDMAEDVEHVIWDLGLSDVTVIGYSDGASIALELGVRKNVPIKNLVLIGANYNPKGLKRKWIIKSKVRRILLTIPSLFFKKARRKVYLEDLMLKQPNFKEGDLTKIKIPVLNVVGDNDAIRYEHTKRLSELLHAKEIMLKGNHDLIVSSYEELNKVIDDFIQEMKG